MDELDTADLFGVLNDLSSQFSATALIAGPLNITEVLMELVTQVKRIADKLEDGIVTIVVPD